MLLFFGKGGDYMTEIGKNIMRRRKEIGLTQEELALKLGYKSKSTINKIELGINDLPQSKVIKFAEALQTTPSYLMGWDKEEKNNNTIASIVIRLRTDSEFFSLVEALNNLDKEKVRGVKQMLTALLK